MNIITYHASDSDVLQTDFFGASSVRIKHQTEYTGRQMSAAAATADLYSFFSTSYSPRPAARRPQPIARHFLFLPRVNPVPVMLIFAFLYVLLAIPLWRTRAGAFTIGSITFGEEPLLNRTLHTSIFPDHENYTDVVPERTSTYISAVTFRDYTVKKGETVSGIASRAGLRNFGTLLSVNSIDNARKVSAGQVLRIPSTDGLLYTVKKNETLAGIAAAFKVDVTVLLDANDLTQEALSVGQQLFIPGAALSSFELRKALGELFIYPIQGRLTSPFGYRSDPFTGAKSFHTGIDLAAPTGTAVKATLDGKVAEAGVNRIYGNYVIITHDRGYQSLYGHLSVIHAKRGQYVTQGTVVGEVGSTGYSTGPHLHLSIYKNGTLIDPFSVLK